MLSALNHISIANEEGLKVSGTNAVFIGTLTDYVELILIKFSPAQSYIISKNPGLHF